MVESSNDFHVESDIQQLRWSTVQSLRWRKGDISYGTNLFGKILLCRKRLVLTNEPLDILSEGTAYHEKEMMMLYENICKRFSCHNFAHLYCHFIEESHLCLVNDYVPFNLISWRSCSPTENDIKGCIAQLFFIAGYMILSNFYHGDMNGTNVLVKPLETRTDLFYTYFDEKFCLRNQAYIFMPIDFEKASTNFNTDRIKYEWEQILNRINYFLLGDQNSINYKLDIFYDKIQTFQFLDRV